jgi:hypothetical protein
MEDFSSSFPRCSPCAILRCFNWFVVAELLLLYTFLINRYTLMLAYSISAKTIYYSLRRILPAVIAPRHFFVHLCEMKSYYWTGLLSVCFSNTWACHYGSSRSRYFTFCIHYFKFVLNADTNYRNKNLFYLP